MIIRRGERWCVMGKNGAGKTTLLKMVAGVLEPDSGRVKLGASLKLGYFAQQALDLLDPGLTVWEQIQTDFPHESVGALRSLLGAFQFSGDDVEKRIRALSGGEKSRLVMARMLFDPPNFLVLDEPTNHLDLATKEMLVEALKDFEGTMLFVSHDRTFLRGLGSRVLELGGESGVEAEPHLYPGSYVEYVAQDRPRGARRPRVGRGQVLNCALAGQGTIQDLTPSDSRFKIQDLTPVRRTSCVRARRYDRTVNTELDLDGGLARLGYEAFRPGQREAIEALLEKGRLLLVAPTGGGKSLIYQLPASLLPGTSLVISPLVSLMHDQVQALEARGVSATFLAATLSAEEMRQRLARLRSGAFKLAYVAPERLAYPGFRALVARPRAAARRRGRGPLHQRVGSRLPPRLPRDRRAPRRAAPAAGPRLHRDRDPRRPGRDPRPARAADPTPRRCSAASRARTSPCGRGTSPPSASGTARWTRSSPRRSASRGPPGGRRSCTRRPAGARRRRPPGSRRGAGAPPAITRG